MGPIWSDMTKYGNTRQSSHNIAMSEGLSFEVCVAGTSSPLLVPSGDQRSDESQTLEDSRHLHRLVNSCPIAGIEDGTLPNARAEFGRTQRTKAMANMQNSNEGIVLVEA